MNIPVKEWQNIMEEQMTKLQKLQTDYEVDLLAKKVHEICSTGP
jgi:hypothetical protein